MPPVEADVLKQGFLHKRGGFVKNWKQRYFVLSKADMEVKYYTANPAGDSTAQLQGAIKLDGAKTYSFTRKVYQDENRKGALFGITVQTGRTYILEASSEAERYQWAEALTGLGVVEDGGLVEGKISSKSPSRLSGRWSRKSSKASGVGSAPLSPKSPRSRLSSNNTHSRASSLNVGVHSRGSSLDPGSPRSLRPSSPSSRASSPEPQLVLGHFSAASGGSQKKLPHTGTVKKSGLLFCRVDRGAIRKSAWKQRFFVLDADERVLREYPSPEAWEGGQAASEETPLQGSKVVSFTRSTYSSEDRHGSALGLTPASGRTMTLETNTEGQRYQWVEALAECGAEDGGLVDNGSPNRHPL